MATYGEQKVNTPTLKEKAGFFANRFGITDFVPSDDWVAC